VKDFAGKLDEQVEVRRRTAGRDALGAPRNDWTLVGVFRAAATPLEQRQGERRRWRLELRPADVAEGDRIDRTTATLEVEVVLREHPDRITVWGFEVRR